MAGKIIFANFGHLKIKEIECWTNEKECDFMSRFTLLAKYSYIALKSCTIKTRRIRGIVHRSGLENKIIYKINKGEKGLIDR